MRNRKLGSHKPLGNIFSSTNQYITLFYVCFCFKISYLIYMFDSYIYMNICIYTYEYICVSMVDSLTLNLCQQHCNSCLNQAYLMHMLSQEANSQPSCAWEYWTALHLGVILNSKVTNKKHKNEKNIALTRPRKGHLFTE